MQKSKLIILIILVFLNVKETKGQTAKDILKKVSKTAKSLTNYEVKFTQFFKYFDYSDTSFITTENLISNSMKLPLYGLSLNNNKQYGKNYKAFNDEEFVTLYDNSKTYYRTKIFSDLKQFYRMKQDVLYKPFKRNFLKNDTFSLKETNDKHFVLEKKDTSFDKMLKVNIYSSTLIYVDKSTYLIDTFLQWFYLGDQLQYEKLILNDFKQFDKSYAKTIKFKADSMIKVLKTNINGDSIYLISQKKKKKEITIGDTLPNIFAYIFDSKYSITLPNKKDSIFILDFFYTSCGPCIASMPALININNKYTSKGIKLYGIDPYTSDWVRLERFVPYHKLNYTILKANYAVSENLGITAYPSLFIIKNGIVVYKHIGFSEKMEEEISKNLNQILNP